MNWEAIGAVGEIVGAAAVVVTLIYVARQIQQNTDQAKLASSHAVDTSNMLVFDPIYSGENGEIWTKGHSSPETLSEHECEIFNMLMTRILLTSFNTTSYHHSRGALETEPYQPNVDYFSSIVATPGGQKWYASHKNFLHAEARKNLERGVKKLQDLEHG